MTAIRCLLAWTVLALSTTPAFAQIQESTPVALSPLERQATVVAVERGEAVSVVAESPDALLALRVYGPGGGLIVELAHRSDAAKQTAFVAARSGAHRVEVASMDPASAGSYRLRVTRRPPESTPSRGGPPSTARGSFASTTCRSSQAGRRSPGRDRSTANARSTSPGVTQHGVGR